MNSSEAEALEAKYEPEPNTGCWLWCHRLNAFGYGTFKNGLAHRAAYELHIGPIPEGLTLDHLCRTPSCVNPAHLQPVPWRENWERGVTNACIVNRAKTHCPRGHRYDATRTLKYRDGRRVLARICTVCAKEWNRKRSQTEAYRQYHRAYQRQKRLATVC